MANVFSFVMTNEYRIYKYPIQVTDKQTIKLPAEYQILCVQVQETIPCIWALIDPDNPEQEVFIETIGTGHPILYEGRTRRSYIGTYQIQGGSLVFHVFETYKI